MASALPSRFLRPALILFGLVCLVGFYPLTVFWPSGWAWQPPQPMYLQMIIGVYAVLGIFLLRAARDPLQHLSLIWFTVWSSVVHAGVMAYHAAMDPAQRGHFVGDVPALLLMAVVLGVLTPREPSA